MNIFVLMKRTFDTEEKIVIQDGKIQEDGAEFIINPYDEYAIEEAIQVRDQHGGKVTVISIGNEEAEKQLQTVIAVHRKLSEQFRNVPAYQSSLAVDHHFLGVVFEATGRQAHDGGRVEAHEVA